MPRIILPKQATVIYLDFFLKAVRQVRAAQNESFTFDFSQTTEISSAFICFVCALFDLAREQGNQIDIITPTNRRVADIIRLIKAIFPRAGRPQVMLADRMCQLRKIPSHNSQPIIDMINILSARLRVNKELQFGIQLAMVELLTNAIDHSHAGACYVCAGAWGRSNYVHFSMLDFGMGIPTSLRTKYTFDSDIDAIKAVLTSTDERGLTTRIDREGGLGYQHIRDTLKQNQGRIHLFSGNAKAIMRFDRRESTFKRSRKPFEGTFIDLQFDISTPPAESELEDLFPTEDLFT